MPSSPPATFAYDVASASDYRSRRLVPAWLMSVGLHTVLLVMGALLISTAPRGSVVEPARTAGIALVQRSDSETTYFSEADATSDEQFASSPAAEPANLSTSLATFPVDSVIELPGAAANLAGGAELGSVMPDAIGLTLGGEGARGHAGGQARTQVFGAEATGTKFVYVFDRSASMDGFGGRPLAAAKAQLLASLDDLDSVHQFQIVFYNDTAAVFHPEPRRPPSIMFASDETKDLARRFVQRMTAAGGTRHMEALRIALGMQPDVLFFLTDAAEPQLTAGELAEIRRRNRNESTIHAIEFGSGPRSPGDSFLMRLARENHGKHVYVDVTKLP